MAISDMPQRQQRFGVLACTRKSLVVCFSACELARCESSGVFHRYWCQGTIDLKTHVPSPGSMNWRRRLGRIVLSILITYLLFVLMFALLQRWLIYLPSRAARIDPQDADLPVGQVIAAGTVMIG